MKPYTYLLIDFFTIIVCLIFSFHRKIQFYKFFTPFIAASLIVAVPFIAWDIWFTHTGVWWFNMDYTLGIDFFGLPLEECLFFICIPFSCIFTYYCLNKFLDLTRISRYNTIIATTFIILCILIATVFYNRNYPFITAMVVLHSLLYFQFIAKVNWIAKATLVYLILLLGFFPVNGILTGTGIESPVVNYNPEEILNLRVFTIPIEDFIYGYGLFLWNLYFFHLFAKHKIQPV